MVYHTSGCLLVGVCLWCGVNKCNTIKNDKYKIKTYVSGPRVYEYLCLSSPAEDLLLSETEDRDRPCPRNVVLNILLIFFIFCYFY